MTKTDAEMTLAQLVNYGGVNTLQIPLIIAILSRSSIMGLTELMNNDHFQSALIAVLFVGSMVITLLYLNTRAIVNPAATWLMFVLTVGVGAAIWRARKKQSL